MLLTDLPMMSFPYKPNTLWAYLFIEKTLPSEF